MFYSTSGHATFHASYHIVWITKYRHKSLTGEMRLRAREITKQICAQMGVRIISGVLSVDHVHMFVEIPPKHAVCDVVRRIKGCLARKLLQEFPSLRKQHWGCHLWARGYFFTTSGNITNEMILNYIEAHLND